MQTSYVPSDSDDDLAVHKNIFMSESTVQNLHSRGWHETDDQNADAKDSRVLQINDTLFQVDDMINQSDSQYEDFLLEVERANDEFFKARGQKENSQRQPSSTNIHPGMAAAANVAFLDGAHDNGLYYDVDTVDDDEEAKNDYCMGNGDENGDGTDEDGVEMEESDDGDDEEDGGDGMDPSAELTLVKVQKVSAGYIINSNVYLTLPQWHTLLVAPEINQTYCVLCDTYIDLDTDAEHIQDSEHLDSFNLFKPLKRFELSITRLIRTRYHCGVCNALFDDQKDDNHVDTEQHGENMLFAINKASDLVYDYNLDRSREDTLDRRHDTPDQRQDTMTYPLNNPTSTMSYSACFTKPARANSVESYRDDTPDPQVYEPDTYDQAADTQTPGISYAAMAKKIKMDELPEFLKIDLGDKLVTVKFDSWHMIISTGLNQLYCMACQMMDHKRVKADHCRSSTHLEKLMKCSVVEVYETHLIRKVGEKLYHCGHCNNLQPIDLMEEHVEQYHPRNRAPAAARPTDHRQSVPASPARCVEKHPVAANQPGSSHAWNQQNHSLLQQFVPANSVKHDSNGQERAQPERPAPSQASNHQSNSFIQQFVGANLVMQEKHGQWPELAEPETPMLNQNNTFVPSFVGADSVKQENRAGSQELATQELPVQSSSFIQPLTQPIHESSIADANKEDLPVTNLQRIRASGLSKTMEFTDNIADSHMEIGQNTKSQMNLAVTQNGDAPKTSPAKDPVDDFQSIWPERSPKVEPQTKVREIDPPAETSGAQNSTDNSEKLIETLEAKLTPPLVPSPQQTQVNPANKNVKVLNFQPDFVKTLHMFGYKLSVHILSLNAIIKLQYFYRCVFCDVNVEESLLLEHMIEYSHMALMPTAPYMPEFSLHLIRRIRMLVHCAICNLVLPNDHLVVLNHNASPTHSFLLKRALGFEAHTAANPLLPEAFPPIIPLPPLIPLPSSRSSVSPNSPFTVQPPSAQNPAPNMQNSAPNMQNQTPNVQNHAPNVHNQAPNVQNPALNVQNPARNVQIPAHNVQNPALYVPNGVAQKSPNSVAKETADSKSAKKASKSNAVAEEVLVNFTEEFYLIKQKKQLVKVNRDALNTIVFCGDGTFFCFVCETNIGSGDSMEHIGGKAHRKCLTESKMLNNYGSCLLRQLENMYHCATCNVIIQKRHLQRHLDWYKHLKTTEDALCDSESARLDENQGAITKIDIPTQKERVNVKDKGNFVIHFSFVIDRNHTNKDSNDNVINGDGDASETVVQRKNKIIIVKDEVFKIKWEHWHGLATYRDGFKCKLCAADFEEDAWREHVQEPRHLAGLDKPLIEELSRDLLRELSNSKLHCLICNVELSTSDNICEHLDGKKHSKNRDLIIEESAKVNAYNDCERDVLFL